MLDYFRCLPRHEKDNLKIMIIFLLSIYLVNWQIYLATVVLISLVEMILFLFSWMSSQLNSMVSEYVEMVESEEGNQEE